MLIAAALALSVGTAPAAPALDPRSACVLPALPREGRLVVLRMSGGDAVSTVAVAGLNQGTTTGEIRIGPGRGPLQLAIVSNEPVIVRFTGEVARVSDVVLINRAGAGVTGLPASKVHFGVGAKCDFYINPAKAWGRTAALSEEINDLHKAWTDGRRFRHQEVDPEYDPAKNRLAQFMDSFYPGGIMVIDPNRVVSSSPAVKYSVLPDTAGLVQLEKSGALVEAGRAEIDAWTAKAKVHHGARLIGQIKIGNYGPVYRVTRPIQLPAGLCGSHSITFLVPSRDYLSGDPCHSEIIAEDGHILAPSYYIDDPDCGLALFEALARPNAPGPLRLRAIYCGSGSPVWVERQSYAPVASPDAKYMAFFPNSYVRLPLKIAKISDKDPAPRDYPVSSTGYFALEWLGRPGYRWSDDSNGVWAAKPLSDSETGDGPIRPAFVGVDGSVRLLPELHHPVGPSESLLWVGGRGLAIARFRDQERFDPATKKLRPPAYGMVDAVSGTLLDDFEAADFERLRQSNSGLKEFFYADKVVAAQLADGRLRALLDLGQWVLWTERETPRVVPDLPRASAAFMSADGRTVLMLRPDLPGQENREIRVFCEDNGEDDRPCFKPDRREGTWASFHDVETGRLLWALPWRFDRHDMLQSFALSPDGRFALVTLPSRTNPNKMLVAVVSMNEGRIMQTLARPYGYFSMGFASGGKIAWIMTGKATILYEVN